MGTLRSLAALLAAAVFSTCASTAANAQPGPWWYVPTDSIGVSNLARNGDVGFALQYQGPLAGHRVLTSYGQEPVRFSDTTDLRGYVARDLREDARETLLNIETSAPRNSITQTYLFSNEDGFTQLNPIAGTREIEGRAMSGDGRSVVGWCDYEPGNRTAGQAFRWTPEGGTQGLGWLRQSDFLSDAYAVSRDGSTVVGASSGFNDSAAFVWSEETGVMTPLPGGDSIALCVNGDGRVVGGNAGAYGAIWRDGVLTQVASPGGSFPTFTAMSDSGDVAVGFLQTPRSEPVYWSEATGCIYLEDFLRQNGVDLPENTNYLQVLDVSADGQTFCGRIRLGTSPAVGFVARVPAPSGLAAGVFLVLVAGRRRR